MIEILNKAEQHYVYFPKNDEQHLEIYELVLHSELSQKNYSFNLTDDGNSSRYYKFNIDFSNVDDGEYNYSISGYDTGLIRIGDIDANHTVNSFDDEIEVIQYNAGGMKQRYQLKEIEIIANGVYNILPDAGYDALSKVVATVNVPSSGHSDEEMEEKYEEGYNSGYTEGYNSGSTIGYTSGITEGIAQQKVKLIGFNINSNGTYTRPDGWSAVTVNVPTGSTINNQNKNVTITANTAMTVTFDNGYTGLGNVDINVNVPQTGHTDAELEEKYQSGYTAGYASGRTDGYSQGYVEGYEVGYNEGQSTSGVHFFNLTVNLASTSIAGLIDNAVVTVSYNGQNTSKTYQGRGVTFELLPGIDYTISFNYVNDYLTPANIYGTTTWGGARSVTATYEYVAPDIPYSEQYLTLEIISGGTLAFRNKYSNNSKEFKYSKNGGEWNILYFAGPNSSVVNQSTLEVDAGDKIRLKSDNQTFSQAGQENYIEQSGNTGAMRYKVYGNIMSLAYGDNFIGQTTIPSSYYFSRLFAGYSSSTDRNKLVDASNLVLPATNLTNYCYAGLFENARYFVAAPSVLPATTLTEGCYSNMFYGCTLLTTSPIINASTLATSCYANMFYQCINLTTPPTLPVTTLAENCYYNMFSRCTSLTTAPALPATTLVRGSYNNMFNGCTSLTSVPQLSVLTANTSNCMTQMFQDCSSLASLKCLIASPVTTVMSNWLYGVSNEGVFTKASGAEWQRGVNGIPTNWTIIEE